MTDAPLMPRCFLYARNTCRMLLRTLCTPRRGLALGAVASLALLLVWWGMRRSLIPVYVIEEHHEALAYWMHAVDMGLIRSKGNTLVHIDAHSDESTPEFIPGMPEFRYPVSDEETAYFLQRNDVFLQGAVMMGLVSRVVWVWPSWDLDLLHGGKPVYEASTVQLGWLTPDPNAPPPEGSQRDPSESKIFCQCVSKGYFAPKLTWGTRVKTQSTAVSDDEPNPSSCSYINHTEPDAERRDVEIPSQRCRVIVSYLSEHVNELEAIQRLAKGWLRDTGSVLLDVDEDYFGCASPSRALVHDDIPWHVIESLDDTVSALFCPKHVRHEVTIDRFVRDVTRQLRESCVQLHTEDSAYCSATFEEALKSTDATVLSEFVVRPSQFCGENNAQVRAAWRRLARELYALPNAWIARILAVGFCLSRAPKSLGFYGYPGAVAVCHGLNEPNSTAVYLHTPDAAEVDQRARTLRAVVRGLPRMGAVTLCRSVRDGYTPRGQWGGIERGVLQAFDTLWRDVGWEVQYDEDLLGGALGWGIRPME